MNDTYDHTIAQELFDLRFKLTALRATLDHDHVIARPLSALTAPKTSYLNEAFLSCKACALPLLRAAHRTAMDLLAKVNDGRKSELGALGGTIKDHIEWAAQALGRDDRVGAWYGISIAWQISSTALRIYAIEQDRRLRSVDSRVAGHRS